VLDFRVDYTETDERIEMILGSELPLFSARAAFSSMAVSVSTKLRLLPASFDRSSRHTRFWGHRQVALVICCRYTFRQILSYFQPKVSPPLGVEASHAGFAKSHQTINVSLSEALIPDGSRPLCQSLARTAPTCQSSTKSGNVM